MIQRKTYCPKDSDFNDYFAHQVGSGFGDIRIVRGPRYQRGYGFGSFFSRLAMPVIRYLGKEALNKGVSIGKRVVQDPQIQQAFKDKESNKTTRYFQIMEYIHASSSPATIAELDLFKFPPTQTVIESIYDTEYRPVGSIAKANVFEFIVPASEHYTDLSASYLYAKMKIDVPTGKSVTPTNNFAASLFEQLDVYLGSVNITPGNSLYHYQSYIDDIFFKYKSPLDDCQMINDTESVRSDRIKDKKEFDIIIPIHAPMFQQEKFLIDNVPISLRFKCAPQTFGLTSATEVTPLSVEFTQLSLFIRRVKLYAPVQMAITSQLEKSPAKYYFQRNEVKSFHLPKDFAANSIDNVYNGQLPRKIIVGFVSDDAFNAKLAKDSFNFEHKNLQSATIVVNGTKIPSTPYQPNFKDKLFMREYFNVFRSMNQDSGLPKINLKYQNYPDKYPLLVFDLTDDGTLASDSGVLSMIKRGNVRMDIQFNSALNEGMHMLVFAIYDSVLQIDAARNIVTDY
uniref:Uncharacterized protein n=2 Tax=Tetranychus urticae TaxID=32264 RepID=A0A158P528_TETUR